MDEKLIAFASTGVIIGLVSFLIGLFFGGIFRRHLNRKRENAGEAAVRRVITKTFPGVDFYLFNDLTLPSGDGTTQIDHVLVSRRGVFVIETKHYTGWIFGDAQSPKWTQTIFHVRNRFQNPIHQNYKHVMAIRELLDFLPPEVVKSSVIFTGDGVFKTEQPQGVFRIGEFVRFVSSHQDEVMTENRLQFCVGRIETMRLSISHRTDTEHQAYLDKKYGEIH